MILGCLIIKFTITENDQLRNHFYNVLCLSEAKGMDIKMTEQEIENVLTKINEYLESQLWMDFEIIEYSRYKLRIIGSIDISAAPNIEIVFKDVFFASTVFNWKTDTSCNIISLLKGDEARKINIKFQVEQGYHLVKFQAEDYPYNFGCLFGIKEVQFKEL